MKVERLSSLFIYGAEEVIAGNAMIYRIRFREPLDLERVRQSYRQMVLENPAVRQKFTTNDETKSYCWEQMNDDEVASLLEKEEKEIFQNDRKIDDEFWKTNTRFPIRVAIEDNETLVLIINHVFTNGRGGLFWFNMWLTYYTKGKAQAGKIESESQSRRPAKMRRLVNALAGVFWVLIYIVLFIRKADKKAANSTIDLTHGRRNETNDKGYSSKRYIFTQEETMRFIKSAKSKGNTVSVELLSIAAQVFFEMYPDKDRMLISVPTDIRELRPWIPFTEPGNYTGSLVMQLYRGYSLKKQITSQYKWIKRGVPYYLPRLIGVFGNEFKTKEHFSSQAKTPIPDRAPFENYTLALSNPGKILFREMEENCEWIAGYAKTQTVFLAFGSLNGRMTMEVGIANNLFDAQEVFGATDKIFGEIKKSA